MQEEGSQVSADNLSPSTTGSATNQRLIQMLESLGKRLELVEQ